MQTNIRRFVLSEPARRALADTREVYNLPMQEVAGLFIEYAHGKLNTGDEDLHRKLCDRRDTYAVVTSARLLKARSRQKGRRHARPNK